MTVFRDYYPGAKGAIAVPRQHRVFQRKYFLPKTMLLYRPFAIFISIGKKFDASFIRSRILPFLIDQTCQNTLSSNNFRSWKGGEGHVCLAEKASGMPPVFQVVIRRC
jgi:hypothetical protein